MKHKERSVKETKDFEVYKFIKRMGGVEATLKELIDEDTPTQWVKRKRKYLTDIYNKYKPT